MNKLILILISIFLTISLSANQKKIIMMSFATKTRAQNSINALKKDHFLYKLSKNYNFDFKARESGKYYILVAEVFHDRKTLNLVYKNIKKRYKGAYISNYTPPVKSPARPKVKPQKKKKVQTLKPKKPILKKHTIKKVHKAKVETPKIKTPKIKISKVKVEVKKPKINKPTQTNYFNTYFHWWYIPLLIIIGIATFYFRKFKKIYDEY